MSRLLRLVLVGLLCSLPAVAQAPRPKAVFEVIEPDLSRPLVGMIHLRVRITTDLEPEKHVASSAYTSLGGAPFAKLTRIGDTYEWEGDLDTTQYAGGAQKLQFNVKMPGIWNCVGLVDCVIGNPLKVYFGDLHAHTSYSDGQQLPVDGYKYAREVAKVDFMILTDHLEIVDSREWADLREHAWKANEDGKFISFPGLEWTKQLGHINLFDPPTRIWPNDLEGLYQAGAKAEMIGQFNHLGFPTDDCWEKHRYSPEADRWMQLMECRNPKEEAGFIQALKLGWHLAPTSTDDTHSPNWGNAGRWTGVLLPSLTRVNLWEALRARHCYSSLDRNCELTFSVNGAVMGDIIPGTAKTAEIAVRVMDPDANDTVTKLDLFEDGAIVATDEPGATNREWTLERTPAAGEHHYFVRVTQADGQMLWSAPIWLTIGG